MAMPNDDRTSTEDMHQRNVPLTPAPNAPFQKRSIFDLPAPLKRIFDKFPLHEYPANALPARAPRARSKHKLHVFIGEDAARRGRPSYNPGCLKWQVRSRYTCNKALAYWFPRLRHLR